MTSIPSTRYPGYNVLDKRDTPSWDEATRTVVDERLATPNDPRFFNAVEWTAVTALCACIMPQASDRPAIPLPALLDAKLFNNEGDGYRNARLLPMRTAWQVGLAAMDQESRTRSELPFASLGSAQRVDLLKEMQRGELNCSAWQGMPSELFFAKRVLHDICGAYYSHPHAWSEIGFGGPANPRGYVRMYFDRHDPWEASEAKPDDDGKAHQENRRAR
jgi:hypothetical protein